MRDFFGKPRYHCKVPDCACGDFYALKDRIQAEQGEEALRQRSMSCQAKSEVTLTCGGCGHRAHEHATVPRMGELSKGGATAYRVVQDACFRKPNFDPSANETLKMAGLPLGAQVLCTGLVWRGPRGGLWVELEEEQAHAQITGGGWMLLKPGSGDDEFGASEAFLLASDGTG